MNTEPTHDARTLPADRSKTNRSRVSNGKLPFSTYTAQGRRLRDLMQDVEAACPLPITEVVRAKVHVVALTTFRIEQIMARVAAGESEPGDDDLLLRLSNAQSRSLGELGIIGDGS